MQGGDEDEQVALECLRVVDAAVVALDQQM
jgi:hypothetical protein